uniref:AN1-type domain-containing protein n=1 Tax=Mus spicilegus TaxID=10103 RepID=A0A8C6N4R9_MUSSI
MSAPSCDSECGAAPNRQPRGVRLRSECESRSWLFQDVQVPVCPLCNAPIPVKRGEIPDVVVGEHMDRDCTFHPGRNRNKVFTHRCSKEGCRKKEMLQLACAQCHGNFCIQHRHPLDHNCQAGSSSASRGRTSTSRAAEQKPSGVSWLAQRLRRTVK